MFTNCLSSDLPMFCLKLNVKVIFRTKSVTTMNTGIQFLSSTCIFIHCICSSSQRMFCLNMNVKVIFPRKSVPTMNKAIWLLSSMYVFPSVKSSETEELYFRENLSIITSIYVLSEYERQGCISEKICSHNEHSCRVSLQYVFENAGQKRLRICILFHKEDNHVVPCILPPLRLQQR